MSSFLFLHIFRRIHFLVVFAVLILLPFPVRASNADEEETKGVISAIVVLPADVMSLAELKSLVDIKEGMPYSRKAVKKGVKLLYLKGGFSNISVEAEGSEGKMTLYFKFTLNERVGTVFFSGNKAIPTRRLSDILTISEFDELNIRAIERQAAAIKEYYRKKGYFQCRVEYRLLGTPGDRKADINFTIVEGEHTHVSRVYFSGNTAFSMAELINRLSVKSGDVYDEERVLAAVRRLESFYRRSGYPGAKADFLTKYLSEKNETEIIVNIEEGEPEGKKIRVGGITFKANSAIGSKTLRKQMLTGRFFSEETFAEDLDAIEFLYRKSGYLEARVGEKGVEYNEDGSRIKIEITIHEGQKTIIKGLEIDGNSIFSATELVKETNLKKGVPLDRWAVDEGKHRISALYHRKGYIYAKVSSSEEFTDDKSVVTVRYSINEGIPVSIGKIVIQGNDFTKDEVIRRELLVKPGDIYNPEILFKSQQRVYRLGYLSSVRLLPVEGDAVEGEKDLLLSVKERKAGAFEFGAGYGTEEGFRGFAELSHRNLYGTGASARLRGDVSQRDSSYLLGFKKPWLFDLPVDGRFTLLDQVTKRQSYSLEKYAAIAGVDKDLTEYIKVSLQYEYEISRLFDVSTGAQIAPEDAGTTDIGTVSPIIVRDSRDNPFNPTTGSVNSFKLDSSAGTATGSEVEFVKYILQSSWYIPVSKKVVWGLSARGGWADAYGKTKEIPISKRFFLGGRTTVRGFGLDSIGPKGTDGSPTGGDTYINLNTEVRFPIYKSIGGLIFLDGGNVWLRRTETVDILNLRSSAGVGLRYLTPIGPLSLDSGWKLDQKAGESEWEWHFTIGNVF